jgi:hypothetical protein
MFVTKINKSKYLSLTASTLLNLKLTEFYTYLINHCENISHLHKESLCSVYRSIYMPCKCCDRSYDEITFIWNETHNHY